MSRIYNTDHATKPLKVFFRLTKL
nr:unnamed protein product [Callosobruchus chinensis]